MLSVKQITPQETFPVRHPVLRPGKPVESCIFDGDSLETTAHFGIFKNNSLAGVISVFEASNALFLHKKQFQIRGMAVLETFQRQGLGEMLVQTAEEYVLDKGGELIWFNAREKAVGFYEKTGYTKTGMPFNIPGIGTHYLMYKIF